MLEYTFNSLGNSGRFSMIIGEPRILMGYNNNSLKELTDLYTIPDVPYMQIESGNNIPIDTGEAVLNLHFSFLAVSEGSSSDAAAARATFRRSADAMLTLISALQTEDNLRNITYVWGNTNIEVAKAACKYFGFHVIRENQADTRTDEEILTEIEKHRDPVDPSNPHLNIIATRESLRISPRVLKQLGLR